MTSDIDNIIARLAGLSLEERTELEKHAQAATSHLRWVPNPGPQTDAYLSPADLVLYGGEGGGGKSHLLLGLGFTQHQLTLILRRQLSDLEDMQRKAIEINGSRTGYTGGGRPRLSTADGRLIAFAGCKDAGDEQSWQGQRFDCKGFDEVTQFLESQVNFHLGWVGTSIEGQRTRKVFASNPPIDATGEWIIGWFRPWLDITHHKPAKIGELRWYVRAPDNSQVEVPDGTPVEFDGKKYTPESRTFIRAGLRDNPYLLRTDYQRSLDNLPEPLRSAVRDGNFMAARPDAPNQVIPTAWILAAQERWKPDGWRHWEMTCMSADPAGGGKDSEEIMRRHGPWFSELHSRKGPETADGASLAAEIIKVRRNGCPIVIDVGGGYAGACILRLKDNDIAAERYVAGAKSTAATKITKLRFANKRAETWWRFREALDPESVDEIALPPDPELRSDLAAPTWELTSQGILIESKDDIRVRIGRSTGKGDACVMCHAPGLQAVRKQIEGDRRGRRSLQVMANTSHAELKRRR